MLRRSLLLMLAAGSPLLGDERKDITDWLGAVVSHLSEENPDDFLRAFRKDIRGRIDSRVRGMIATSEVASTVDILTIEAHGDRRLLDLDWSLNLRPRADATGNERRRERVHVEIEKAAKGWLIVAIDSVEFLGPPRQ